ncbi:MULTISPECIES: hypothetical protein [Bacillati]|uniref:hypothetical protein n=1 Tax=Bacillati TaxID=1783272 RepID=UPI0022B9BAD9|nr:hypothetical protein [Caldifermentibacillus hisashii]
MKKETIIIIDEKGTFREGMRKLIELHFSSTFNIIDIGYQEFLHVRNSLKIKLIITSGNYNHQTLEGYQLAKNEGSKLILLILNTDDLVPSYMGLDLFNGILLKNMPTYQLLNVIDNILHSNDVYIDPQIGYLFLRELLK